MSKGNLTILVSAMCRYLCKVRRVNSSACGLEHTERIFNWVNLFDDNVI
jgi:hypothetical protein